MNRDWNNILGHADLVRRLRLMQVEDRLPHAMLFCGAEGVGKTLAAEALAAALLCHEPRDGQCCGICPSCQALQSGSHPDFFELRPEGSGKAAKTIRIDAVREMQAGIARVPLLSQRRAVIIHGADRMNEAAANCLLKTIEEPVGQAVFILLTSRPEALLDTIISRCMRVGFGILQRQELLTILEQQGIGTAEAERLAAISDGSVTKALALREPELVELQERAFALAKKAGHFSAQEILNLAKEMSEHDREHLVQWLGFLTMIYRDLLVLYTGSGAGTGSTGLTLYNSLQMKRLTGLLTKYPQGELTELLRLVQQYQLRLGSNVNLQLCLEGFIIRLNNLLED